eukprot:jgi/Picre1/35511/NNA_002972.t1
MGNGPSKPPTCEGTLDKNKYSVIIPALNEEQSIAAAVQSAQHPGSEVIVVDGGSRDGTIKNAEVAGACVICTSRSDSTLPQDFCTHMDSVMKEDRRWGCFESIDIGADVHPILSRAMQIGVALRTRWLSQPYGDQGIFVERETFRHIGGYRNDYQLLEDVDLVQKLRRTYGRPAIIPCSLQTSGRRWKNLGFIKTTLLNQYILVRYAMGADVNTLAELYRSMK